MNARLYGAGLDYVPDGEGGYTELYWDAWGDLPLQYYVDNGLVTVDTSKFDNTKPGRYYIGISGENWYGIWVEVVED